MTTKTKGKCSAALAACVGLAVFAEKAPAALLFTTGFDAAVTTVNPVAYADGPLLGQNGWVDVSSTVNPIAVSNSATNGIITLTNNGQDLGDNLSSNVTSGSIYLAADLNLSAALTGDYFLCVGTGTSIFGDRIYAKSSGSGYQLGISPSNVVGTATPTYGSTVYPFGTTEHVVAEYDVVAGTANDTAELYVNPTSDPLIPTTDVPVATSSDAGTGGTDIALFSTVNLRQGSATLAPSETIDNIQVASVAAVPEPVSLSCVGFVSALLLGRRRRTR